VELRREGEGEDLRLVELRRFHSEVFHRERIWCDGMRRRNRDEVFLE
jgi:hypothetical protein